MNKPKLLALAVVCCLALTACTAPAAAPTPTPAATPTAEATATPDASESALPSTVPEEAITEDAKVEAMLPIFDSLIRTIGVDGEIPYTPDDPDFFWTALYLWGANFGPAHALVTAEADAIVVPRQTMQEVASAMFFPYDDLLAIPESLLSMIEYSEEDDAYRLAPSDAGDTVCSIASVSPSQESSLVVDVTLSDATGAALGAMRFHLIGNPYADGISEPTYHYTVDSATPVFEE